MASINEVAMNNKVSYYDPKEDKQSSFKLATKHKYPAHIVEAKIREVAVKGKYRANVYNLVFEIASACSDYKYKVKDKMHKEIEISGDCYIGRKMWGQGIFMFLQPSDDDNFEANNGGNENYLSFCDKIGFESKEIDIEFEGESRTVKEFPILGESDLLGRPLVCYLEEVRYKDKDGNFKTTMKVKSWEKWEDAEVRDLEVEDLPF